MARSSLTPGPIYRRTMPHIQPPGATFFITFRLAGSIPLAVLQALHKEDERERATLERVPDSPQRDADIYRQQRRSFGKCDAALAQSAGPDWLRQPEIATLVAQALHHFDHQRYHLLAFCIMPNHVHVVLTPLPRAGKDCYTLAQIMHGLKGYTGRRANAILGRTGDFWQHESYDHFVRDAAELERIVAYVLNNPVQAGLVHDWRSWPWTHIEL